MPAPVRVAQVVGNLETGGMQAMVMALMRGLDRSRFEPILVHFKNANHFSDEITGQHWPCVKIPMSRSYRRPHLARFAEFLRSERIELIHAHADFASFASRMAALLSTDGSTPRPRTIAHYQNTYHHRLDDLFIQREGLLSPSTDLVIACSKGVEAFLRETFDIGNTPLRLIPNGIDPVPFQEACRDAARIRAELGVPESVFHIVHTARLEPHKSPERLLEAAQMAREQLEPFRVTFVGGGSLLEPMKALASEMGLLDHVHLAGWSREVDRWLASADAFVLCSQNEGLPLSLVEAMTAEVPVVASNIIGPQEIVTSGVDGLLVESETPWKIAEALVALRQDLALRDRLRAAGRERAALFTHRRFAQQVMDAYDEVLAAPARNGQKPLSAFGRWRLMRNFQSGKSRIGR